MLTLADSFRLGDVTLWRDREVRGGERKFTSRFYALPDAPRLARAADGGPAFDFLWYRRPADDTGPEPPHGGLVILTADLALEGEERDELAAAIVQRFAGFGEPLDEEVEILPVPFHDGSVELAFAGEAPAAGDGEFARRIAGSGPARLAGSQSASFLIELNSDGASLLAQAIENGTNLFELRYDLVFAHRLDGVELRVWCDAERTHSVVAQGRSAGALAIPALRESLVEGRIAGIEMVTTEPLDPEHQAALQTLGTTVLEAALAATYGAESDRPPGPFDPSVASRLNFTFSQSYPVEQPLALQALLSFDDPRFEPGAFEDCIRKVEPGRGFFDVLEVQVFATVDFAGSDGEGGLIDKVKVTLTYNHAAPGNAPVRRQGELVLQRGQTTGTFRTDLAAPDLRSVSYQVEVHFDGGAPPMRFSHPPVETEVIVLDLDACGVLAVDVELRDAPFDRVRGSVVDLAFGENPGGADASLTQRLILNEGNPAGSWRQVIGDRPGALRWKATWLGAGEQRIETDWQTTTQRRLLLDAPDALTQRAEVELLASGDFSGLEQILVDIEPVDGSGNGSGNDAGINEQFAFRQSGERHLWRPSVSGAGPGDFRYLVRQSLVLSDGRVQTLPPVESDRRLFVVRDAGRRQVQVVSRLLDLGGAWTLALLTLEAGAEVTDQTPPSGDRKSLVIRNPEDRPTWSFRASLDDANEVNETNAFHYSYRLTLVPPTGERVVTPWISGRDEVLVLRPPQDH